MCTPSKSRVIWLRFQAPWCTPSKSSCLTIQNLQTHQLKKSSHEHQPHLPSTLATPKDSSRDTGAPSLPGRGALQMTGDREVTQCRRSRLHQEWGVGPVGHLKWGFNQPWIRKPWLESPLSVYLMQCFIARLVKTPAQHDSRQGPKLLTMDLLYISAMSQSYLLSPRAISCHWNGWDQLVKAHYLQSPCFLVTIFCRLTSIFLVLKLLGFRLKSRLSIGSRSLSIHKCVVRIVSHNILTLWLIHILSAAFWRHPAFHQLLVVIIDLPEISPRLHPARRLSRKCGSLAAKKIWLSEEFGEADITWAILIIIHQPKQLDCWRRGCFEI